MMNFCNNCGKENCNSGHCQQMAAANNWHQSQATAALIKSVREKTIEEAADRAAATKVDYPMDPFEVRTLIAREIRTLKAGTSLDTKDE